jgi:hypothetical protein
MITVAETVAVITGKKQSQIADKHFVPLSAIFKLS